MNDGTLHDLRPMPPRFEAEAIESALARKLFDRSSAAVALGRFALLERAGEGGMGVVYRAHDPKLQRQIALKLVRPDVRVNNSAQDKRMARLLAEARAAARITHPNVVAVHEVDAVPEGLYIAMEYVDGRTLRDWCEQEPRPWADVLDMFVGAGQGLAAAHDVGIVHRDFKPDNVLIGEDSRPRVADFGLAHAQAADPTGDDETTDGQGGESLTRTGAVMGTLAYMSPEQLRRDPLGPASDQFSFCVALWEGLWRQRPYSGGTVDTLLKQVATGRREPLPTLGGVPRGVLATLGRGLDPDPERRFPSMRALLQALERQRHAPRRRRRNLIGAGALLVAAGLGAGAYAQGWSGAEPCGGGPALVAPVWNESRAEDLRSRFAETDRPFADFTATRTIERVDAYVAQWQTMYTEACEATSIHLDQSQALLDLRMSCLKRALSRLDAFAVEALAADAESVLRAVAGAEGLPRLDTCADEDRLLLAAPVPTDPSMLAAMREANDATARAEALELGGRYADGLAVVESAVEAASRSEHAPTEAEALNALARLRASLGQDGAVEARENAFLAGLRGGADTEAIEAAIGMIPLLDTRAEDRPRAQLWSERATALIDRIGGSTLHEAQRVEQVAAMNLAAGATSRAVELFQRSVELAKEANVGPLEEATMTMRLARAHTNAGSYKEAGASLQGVLTVVQRELGADHPRVADVLLALGALEGRQGHHEASFGFFERGVKLLERSLGAHASTAKAHANLGSAARYLGRTAIARQEMRRALEMLEATVGPESREVHKLLVNLGNLAASEGRGAEAAAFFERALKDPANPVRDHALEGRGGLYQDLGEYDKALALYREAKAIRDKVGKRDLAIQSQLHIASALLAAERLEPSIEAHEIALQAMQDAGVPDHYYAPDARFGIGEALARLGRHADALPHFEAAEARWAAGDPDRPDQLEHARLRLEDSRKQLR